MLQVDLVLRTDANPQKQILLMNRRPFRDSTKHSKDMQLEGS